MSKRVLFMLEQLKTKATKMDGLQRFYLYLVRP